MSKTSRLAYVMFNEDKAKRVPSSSQSCQANISVYEGVCDRRHTPVTNGISATLPFNTSSCGGPVRNFPSARGTQLNANDWYSQLALICVHVDRKFLTWYDRIPGESLMASISLS